MSEARYDEGNIPEPSPVGDAEICSQLNQEELLARVRRMNEDLEATCIPLHDVPVGLVVHALTTEKKAVSWARLCQAGGRPAVAEHIRRVIRTTSGTNSFPNTTTPTLCSTFEQKQQQQQQQRRPLTWEGEYPRSRFRGQFKPPAFDDEPSDSSEDEAQALGSNTKQNI